MKNEKYDFEVRKDLGGYTILILSEDLLVDVHLGLVAIMNPSEYDVAVRPEDMSSDRDKAAYALWDAIHEIRRLT